MTKASRSFQVFVKPAGSICNLGCQYCYYLKKRNLYPDTESFRMSDDMLEHYIVQHIRASPDSVIRFSWHGGEPTILGLDYFQKIVKLQRKYQPSGQIIANGIQTNGTLLNDKWCRFLAEERFSIGLSLDGPREMHDRYRVTKEGKPTHRQAMRGYSLLRQHNVVPDILCVVNAHNVLYPLQVYRFFKEIKARYIGFLPLVEQQPESGEGVSSLSVPAEAFGEFLCAIFDEWQVKDIGKVKVQTIEEAALTAFGQEHELCIFRKTCGDVPVVEHNGDLFSCDHYVDREHLLGNIRSTPFVELLESREQALFGMDKADALPRCCKECEVLDMCNGECPKNRFVRTPDGEEGLNYLCAGYKRFFNHCRPFVKELSDLWRMQNARQQMPRSRTRSDQVRTRVGRNDPCPCGSGRKYKKCCMGK